MEREMEEKEQTERECVATENITGIEKGLRRLWLL